MTAAGPIAGKTSLTINLAPKSALLYHKCQGFFLILRSSLLSMMKIVTFRRQQKWEVVAAVVDGSADDDHSKPEPAHGKVGPGHYRTGNHWTKVNDKLLQGVAVDGSHTHWSCPLVMRLVDVLV